MDRKTEVQVVFTVEPNLESGAFVAYWDDPSGGGITTQANSLSELRQAIKEAVVCHFSAGTAPQGASLHFADAELQLA